MAHDTTGAPTGPSRSDETHDTHDTDAGSTAAKGADGTATAPAPPKDDLVTTSHTLKIGRRTLRYRATTGRVVLREEVLEDGIFAGVKPKAEMSHDGLRRRRRRAGWSRRAPASPAGR